MTDLRIRQSDSGTAPISSAHVREQPVSATQSPPPALAPGLRFARAVLLTLVLLVAAFLVQITIVSRFQHSAEQQRAFESYRQQLAIGTAPAGPIGSSGEPLERGQGVARLEITSIGLDQIVVHGTDSATLFGGPGHRIDTVLPGQIGTSVVLGRRSAYGGPFSRLADLQPGDIVLATTGQGRFEYSVTGVRREGDPVPPPIDPLGGRLTLVTADGVAFVPSGVLRVDADLVGPGAAGSERLVTAAELPAADRAMAADRSDLWRLALWLQALLVVAVGAIWCWHRWHPVKVAVVATPVLALVGLAAAGELTRHLPNLL